jgi:hypothetical protein
MVKSVAETNQKLVARLCSELDLKAVQSALNRGEITPRQAQYLTKLIRTSNVIRGSAHRSAAVFDEATSQYVGEVTSKNDGASWIGRRYGWNYPRDSAEFAEQDDAVRFVGTKALHQAVAETKARNAAVPTEQIQAAIEEALAAVRIERFGSRRTDLEMSKPSAEDEFTPSSGSASARASRPVGSRLKYFYQRVWRSGCVGRSLTVLSRMPQRPLSLPFSACRSSVGILKCVDNYCGRRSRLD